jgi:ribosomal protein L31
MISEHIESLGVELECGALTTTFDTVSTKFSKWGLSKNLRKEFDGSIKREQSWTWKHHSQELTFWSDKLLDLKHFLSWTYKAGDVRTNNSCGFHIHVKFKNHAEALYYFARREIINKFHTMYSNKFKDNQKYISRFSNKYSKKNTKTTRELLQTYVYGYNSRYSSVNFISTQKHRTYVEIDNTTYPYPGTLEFRLFPYQESADEAYKTILWFVKTLEVLMFDFDKSDFWIQVYF